MESLIIARASLKAENWFMIQQTPEFSILLCPTGNFLSKKGKVTQISERVGSSSYLLLNDITPECLLTTLNSQTPNQMKHKQKLISLNKLFMKHLGTENLKIFALGFNHVTLIFFPISSAQSNIALPNLHFYLCGSA